MIKKAPKKQWKSADFEKAFLPGLAIDSVIFGFHENKMMVLLLQYKNTNSFALPGGFVFKEEDVNEAAQRILQDRTNLKDIYLEQFYLFGDSRRQDNSMEIIMKARGMNLTKNHFLLRRFVSIGYYALIDYTKAIPTKDEMSDDFGWYDINKVPSLIQDHKKIIQKALETLRENFDKKLIGFKLLGDQFTMGELQKLYETILGVKYRRTSFQRKMINLNILKQVAVKKTGAANKAPYLYTFKKEK
jgi:ADP-ribose pyrophosphatase YjhB (NUDIX family)